MDRTLEVIGIIEILKVQKRVFVSFFSLFRVGKGERHSLPNNDLDRTVKVVGIFETSSSELKLAIKENLNAFVV